MGLLTHRSCPRVRRCLGWVSTCTFICFPGAVLCNAILSHVCHLLLSHGLYLGSSVGSNYQPQLVAEAGHWDLPGHLGMYWAHSASSMTVFLNYWVWDRTTWSQPFIETTDIFTVMTSQVQQCRVYHDTTLQMHYAGLHYRHACSLYMYP